MCLEGEYANSKLHEALTETTATLRAVEAERDAYRRVVQKLCATGDGEGKSGRPFVVGQYTMLAERSKGLQDRLYFGLIAEALGAVPYDPAWDDEKPEGTP